MNAHTMMRYSGLAVAALLAIAVPALAGTGADNAGNGEYVANSWGDGQNAGSGFGAWTMQSETVDGYAGFYATDDMDGSHGVDNVGVEQTPPLPYTTPGTEGYVWASYANKGSGIDRATAFRGLSESLDGAGDTLSASFEHGFVNGQAGIALRTANVTDTAADYATGARAQFYFRGGTAVYTIEDDAGSVELDGTGGLPYVPFTFFGVDVEYTLIGADTYDITITKYNSEAGSGGAAPDVFDKSSYPALGGRSLAGTGTLDSVALFQHDVETQSDVFFNNLVYSTTSGGGADDADDSEYDYGWDMGTNGGSGFGVWLFATETDGGYAGQFIQSGVGNGVDNIGTPAPDGNVWASYANKGNYADKAVEYRDFDDPLAAAGDTFSVSLENGFVDPGGKIGVSLRDEAAGPFASFDETPDDYATDALFQFYFEGGDDNYTVVDATGEVDTGVGFSFWGIDLDVTLTSATTFNLNITRYGEADDPAPVVTSLTGLAFAGTAGNGTIESLALFNIDAPNQGDVFFNSLSYENVTGLAGDYNGDGTIDAADYTVWRDTLTAGGTGLLNDPTPGVVDSTDFDYWKAHYGESSAAGSGSLALQAVPEPSTIWLALLALIGWIQARRQQPRS